MPKIPRVRPPSPKRRRSKIEVVRPASTPTRTPTPTAINQASATGPGASQPQPGPSIGTSTAVGAGQGYSPTGDFAGAGGFAYDGPVMGGLEGVHPELARRISALSAATGGAVTITSGYRSYDEQAALYEQNRNGGPPTARPGQSNHNHGLAVDVGGYDSFTPEMLARFGLVQAVPGEPWHLELSGDVAAGAVGDDHFQAQGMAFDLGGDQNPEDVLANRLNVITSMLGMDMTADPYTAGDTGMLPGDQDPAYNIVETPQFAGMGQDPDIYPSATQDSMQGKGDLQRFMGALRQMESGGNYGAIGPSTRYGNATGAYQFLDSTWQSRPGTGGYRRAADAPPEVQDRVASEYMQELYQRYGDWQLVAVAWHGGEGAANRAQRTGLITGSDVNMATRDYANRIVGMMNGGGGGPGGGSYGGGGGGGRAPARSRAPSAAPSTPSRSPGKRNYNPPKPRYRPKR